MLSIGKLTVEQARYYERQVAQGRDDYYSGRGDVAGAVGQVAEGRLLDSPAWSMGKGFTALMEGRHPGTGEPLRRVGGRSKVAAFYLTFSAPKRSASCSRPGSGAAGPLVEAHEAAVEAALAYVEREASGCVAAGRRAREAGEGFVAAAYRHRMCRSLDPQLHTHVVAANMARGADGAGRP